MKRITSYIYHNYARKPLPQVFIIEVTAQLRSKSKFQFIQSILQINNKCINV